MRRDGPCKVKGMRQGSLESGDQQSLKLKAKGASVFSELKAGIAILFQSFKCVCYGGKCEGGRMN